MLAIFENICQLKENVADEDRTIFLSHDPVGLHSSYMGNSNLWSVCTHHAYAFNLSYI